MTKLSGLKKLEECLADRDISFSAEELGTAWETDSEGVIQQWIEEYISHDTLLTKDELALYNTFKSSPQFPEHEHLDYSDICPIRDEELVAAIEELKKQTSTIEKQTETLKLQQEAVASLLKQNKTDRQSREAINTAHVKAWTAEKASLTSKIAEESRTIAGTIADMNLQTATLRYKIQQHATEILKDDDRLLSDLQRQASSLSPEDPAEEEAAQRVQNLCVRLIKYTIEGVRTRLDRVYLESIDEEQGGDLDEIDPAVGELQAELESLHSEILPVAQMSTEHQFLKPAAVARAARGAAASARIGNAFEDISDDLKALNERLKALTTYAMDHQGYRALEQHFSKIAKAELATITSSTSTKQRVPSSIEQPKQVLPVSKNRRRSSIDNDIQPEQQILRNLGLSIQESNADPSVVTAKLLRDLEERRTRLKGHALSLQESEEQSIASSLVDARLTLQQLKGAVLAETKYNTIRFVDEEVEEAILLMEDEVENLKTEIDAIDLDKSKERNVQRDALVERWGR